MSEPDSKACGAVAAAAAYDCTKMSCAVDVTEDVQVACACDGPSCAGSEETHLSEGRPVVFYLSTYPFST